MNDSMVSPWTGFFLLVGALVVISGLIGGCAYALPQYNLYKANTEKQSVIREQEAISEAEVYAAEKRVTAATADADARRIEAQGIADSQRIIAETLTPEYLQWRFFEVLNDTSNSVIYIPTEGSIPIVEAPRSVISEDTLSPSDD